mmetsp:Transcript_31604/g.81773  ORF Transcript_31604/g.81773 Transcript_31604/m.81773 type:complete len:222 (+) Transcript_31604:419-1084(+)
MCLFCFSSEEPEPDNMKGKYGAAYAPFLGRPTKFDITMCQAPCKAPGCWCAAMFCLPCANFQLRHKALNHVDPGSGWANYNCCQGYYGGCCCLQPGNCCDSRCPVPCMCLEGCLCPGLAASVNSMMIREKYGLGLDRDDVRLIRCSNCLQVFACVLGCLSMCCDWDGERACVQCVDCVADVTFCCVAACVTAQANHEIKVREAGGVGTFTDAPGAQGMTRE